MSEIDQSLARLRTVYNRLMNTDASQLPQPDKTKLAVSIQKTSLLIRRIETAQIQGLTQAAKQASPQLDQATEKLADTLDNLKDSTQIIGVVSNFLDTTTKVWKLFA